MMPGADILTCESDLIDFYVNHSHMKDGARPMICMSIMNFPLVFFIIIIFPINFCLLSLIIRTFFFFYDHLEIAHQHMKHEAIAHLSFKLLHILVFLSKLIQAFYEL